MTMQQSIVRAAVVALLLAGAANGGGAQEPGRATQNPKVVWTGLSKPSRIAAIACQEDGVLTEVKVVEGTRVPVGGTLVLLDAAVQEAKVARLRLRANSDIRIREARQKLAVVGREAARLAKLGVQDIASPAQLERMQLEQVLARIALDSALVDQQLALAELCEAQRLLDRFTLKSPFAGTIAKIHLQVGDSVRRQAPVMQLVEYDPLWVEFDCSLDGIEDLREGSRVWVRPVASAAVARMGVVVHRSVLADPASQTRSVRVTVPNAMRDWVPGSKMQIHLASPESVPAKPK